KLRGTGRKRQSDVLMAERVEQARLAADLSDRWKGVRKRRPDPHPASCSLAPYSRKICSSEIEQVVSPLRIYRRIRVCEFDCAREPQTVDHRRCGEERLRHHAGARKLDAR